ncbi:helix-turn-helix transcriptional regulator [Natrinema sp. DC36]|uniref:helix-turn-helix transcriptional regulator n=1 Tax=Natrinema sp. DC36 TaxID=2878680 RepID=UPI001CF0105A|nr:helix-turn-helix transcriptional regulator [Natrinema sp. DC36]
MSTDDNPTENSIESAEKKSGGRTVTSSGDSRVIADGGVSWSDLNSTQRDILEAIGRLEADDQDSRVYGLGIKREYEQHHSKSLNGAQLYPNLDKLRDYGLIEKHELDRRTNEYPLTDAGRSMLQHHVFLAADACGLSVEKSETAATDGGRDVQ